MNTVQATMRTYPPKVVVGPGNPEAAKYCRLWDTPEYRAVAPGENIAPVFLSQARPRHGSHVIDFGCGTGRGASVLRNAGMKVTMLDFARNCLDESVAGQLSDDFCFVKHDLEQPSPVIAEYGFCTDVMEHIPPEKVDTVIENILRAAKHCFFSISTKSDVCGAMIGATLHVSEHSFDWWQQKFQEFHCVVHWSAEVEGYACFYLTAWEDAQVVVDNGQINITEAEITANIRKNCGDGWQQVIPHPTQDTEVMIVGSGPSLTEFEDDIRAKRAAGVKLVTLNGAYNWAVSRGMTPSATVIVDARASNARFTKPVVDGCKYLLASQCNPSVLDGLPKDRTYLWHVMSDLYGEVVREFFATFWPVPGGSTVLLRAIPLLRMLGYHRFHVYGADSCLANGKHHAFDQPENDGQHIVPIMVTGGRVFYCHPWMVAQAKEWVTMIEKIGSTFDAVVYGDGLLSHIINTGAEMLSQEEE